MASHIPFVNTARDCEILKEYYKDSHIVRVSLETINRIKGKLPKNVPLWIDPAIDGYHHRITTNWPTDRGKWNDTQKQLWNTLEKIFSKHTGHNVMCDKELWIKSNLGIIKSYVNNVLGDCYKYEPSWISIPQLPLVNDGSRNKINKWLAEAAREWAENISRNIKLILPVIFTSTTQLTRKPIRDRKFKLVKECYEIANADGIWVADTTLSDQNRNEQYPNRYAKLIEFHENLNQSFVKGSIKICGPYWGINLILWARGLCDYPAISLGSPYIYYISCGTIRSGSIRLAIPPIKRWVVASRELHAWLKNTLAQLSTEDPIRKELSELTHNFNIYRQREHSVEQIAKFYKKWFNEIETVPEEGRALALFQNLSSAYVFGKQLENLPKTALPYYSDKILGAGKTAEQLMLKCL